jgi:hypothetical protein
MFLPSNYREIPWLPVFVIAMIVVIFVWIVSLTSTEYEPEKKHIPKDTVYTRAKVVTVENNDTLYIITLDE